MIRRKINIRPADVARTTALTVPRTTSKKGAQNCVHAGKVNSCSLQCIGFNRGRLLIETIPREIPLESPFQIQVCYNCLCSREIPKFPSVVRMEHKAFGTR